MAQVAEENLFSSFEYSLAEELANSRARGQQPALATRDLNDVLVAV
jgi:hypothetical protein